MRTLYRILSVVSLFTLMSGPALLAQEDRQYDPQTDDQATVAESSQPSQPEQPTQDPPARAARLQYMNGSVSVQPHGTDDWVAGQESEQAALVQNGHARIAAVQRLGKSAPRKRLQYWPLTTERKHRSRVVTGIEKSIRNADEEADR